MPMHVDIGYDVFFLDFNALCTFWLFLSLSQVLDNVPQRIDLRMQSLFWLHELTVQVIP